MKFFAKIIFLSSLLFLFLFYFSCSGPSEISDKPQRESVSVEVQVSYRDGGNSSSTSPDKARDSEGCSTHSDCNSPSAPQCVRGFCIPNCSTPSDCPDSVFLCIRGFCVSKFAQCQSNSDCKDPKTPICLNRRCVPPLTSGCKGPVDCPPEKPSCVGGVCVKKSGCSADGDCPPEKPSCVGGVCVKRSGCSADGDCPPEKPRCVGGVCVKKSGCSADGDCPPEKPRCVGGVCVKPGCSKDSDCSGSTPLCEGGKCVACSSGLDSSKFINEDVRDGTRFKPGERFRKRWRLRNTGKTVWAAPCGYRFAHTGVGPRLTKVSEVRLKPGERVRPGQFKDWYVDMVAPIRPGKYRGYWQMFRNGRKFGTKVWVEIVVVPCKSNSDCKSPVYPVCRNGSCAAPECRSNADCAKKGKKFCVNNSCVLCRNDGDCGGKGRCVGGTCQVQSSSCGNGPKPTSYTWPTPKNRYIFQKFGKKIKYQTCGFHTGLDIPGRDGNPILSMADGKVVHVGPMWLKGPKVGRGPYAIIIQHSKGFYSTYSHNRRALVKKGDCVKKGQQIAEIGNLGYSSGPHLHFEVLEGTSFTGSWQTPFKNACKYYVDPLKYVKP